MKSSTRIGGVALAALFFAACESRSPTLLPFWPTQPVITVAVAPTAAMIMVGQSIHITPTVNVQPTGTAYSVVWTSSNPSQVSVDSTGFIHGIATSPGVSVCATATPVGGASAKGCADVLVSAPFCFGPEGQLTPALDTIQVGATAQFQIPPAQLNGRSLSVIRWAVDNPAIAGADSLTGVVTAKNAGSANVIATDHQTTICPNEWRAVLIVH